MSIIDYSGPESQVGYAEPVKMPDPDRPLHQLALVRRRQDISRRTLARRLGVDVARVKLQEQETSDMLLSTLYQWQEALEVPVDELLVDTHDPLSPLVLKRAQMLRLMKTAKTILHRANQLAIRRMAQMLIEQLAEIMPELNDVMPWHAVGQRRTQSELGQAAQRRLTTDWPHDAGE